MNVILIFNLCILILHNTNNVRFEYITLLNDLNMHQLSAGAYFFSHLIYLSKYCLHN